MLWPPLLPSGTTFPFEIVVNTLIIGLPQNLTPRYSVFGMSTVWRKHLQDLVLKSLDTSVADPHPCTGGENFDCTHLPGSVGLDLIHLEADRCGRCGALSARFDAV